ncbi:MAG: hypothetical protein COV72_07145 [Candidatus Omnitrophica bacterium CG11_big_fil_rev_8_21_14_0_20_42_13]|uniref:Uncharacterized protein n=1 Tax=Candidatus Ghiorseimicrobium undicola TaxID=1974746 RepID=A0A2H0LWF3_9BACT|nr:MAG: hypothetical protein COV72_07145 [Candidatus Omnitrophica bacterium CG11_big_fil_rev_8_21_14_0_20_42_13]
MKTKKPPLEIEIEYKPMSEKDYDIFIKILTKMFSKYMAERKTKIESNDKPVDYVNPLHC